MAGLDEKDITIKTNKSANDDKSYLSMSVLLDIGHIPWKKQKRKVPETLTTGNKVTQDPDDTNEESKVVVALKELNRHQYV